MSAEKNLQNLLGSMSPELIEGSYVFCSIKNATYGDFSETRPVASFAEKEGLTLVVPEQAAIKAGLRYEGVFRCISLGIHSSLEAVGLTAHVSGKLAENGIAANVIAAYFHDHIFVPSQLAERAIEVLSARNDAGS